jgi:hypothetical protein
VLFPRLEGSTGTVVLVPGSFRVMSEVVDPRSDGRWRFVAEAFVDAWVLTTDDIDRLTLGPGPYHLVSHRIDDAGPRHEMDATVAFDVRLA